MLVVPLLALLVTVLPLPPSFFEVAYSRGVYPGLAWLLISLTGRVPFSLALLLGILPVVALIALVRSKHRWRTLGRGLGWLLWGCGLFQLLWGLNYRREPIESLLELPTRAVTTTDFERLASGLLEVITQNASAARDQGAATRALRESLARTVQGITGQRPTLPLLLKSPPAGWLLAVQVSGVISPLTLEAHVDVALPAPFYLATSVHELAHLCGFAGEADADLLAAISGLEASDAYARYATALSYYARVYAELPALSRSSLSAALPPQARADFEAYRGVLRRYALPAFVTNVTQSAYDRYLRAQGVQAGIRDYSRVVRLLAQWWFKTHRPT